MRVFACPQLLIKYISVYMSVMSVRRVQRALRRIADGTCHGISTSLSRSLSTRCLLCGGIHNVIDHHYPVQLNYLPVCRLSTHIVTRVANNAAIRLQGRDFVEQEQNKQSILCTCSH